MIFGEFDCAQAEGLILAHTLKLPARTLKKGSLLGPRDLADLAQAGIRRVSGARLDADELGEDEAAGAVAVALAGQNVDYRKPYTGRCNLHARVAGIVLVDRQQVDRLNLVDESITLATLPPYAAVRKGQVLATVKVIPFGVARRIVDACHALAAGAAPLSVAEFRPRRCALILSELPGARESVRQSTVAATAQRLEALGSRLVLELRCKHEPDAVRRALTKALAARCEFILVAGATVTKDRADVVPAAIVAAGGEIEHFGMPVEPGNMLLLARVGAVPVVNLPGCARSKRANGLDWVLQRLLADVSLTRADIMTMGVGGLIRSPLEEDGATQAEPPAPAARPPVRLAAAAHAPAPPGAPRVAALVLAAGRSARMGADNKLLMPVEGKPMIAHAVAAARGSQCAPVIIVTGHQAEQVEAAVGLEDIAVIRNRKHAEGLSASLRAGLRALPADIDAVVVLLGDMPRVSAEHIDRLIARFDAANPRIVVPEKGGRRGNPVLWPRRLFDEMREIEGDTGARALILRHAAEVETVSVEDDGIFLDVDTPAAMAQLARP